MVLGNDQDCPGGCFEDDQIFGGPLYKLNVFSIELTREEIDEMLTGFLFGAGGEVRESKVLKVGGHSVGGEEWDCH